MNTFSNQARTMELRENYECECISSSECSPSVCVCVCVCLQQHSLEHEIFILSTNAKKSRRFSSAKAWKPTDQLPPQWAYDEDNDEEENTHTHTHRRQTQLGMEMQPAKDAAPQQRLFILAHCNCVFVCPSAVAIVRSAEGWGFFLSDGLHLHFFLLLHLLHNAQIVGRAMVWEVLKQGEVWKRKMNHLRSALRCSGINIRKETRSFCKHFLGSVRIALVHSHVPCRVAVVWICKCTIILIPSRLTVWRRWS